MLLSILTGKIFVYLHPTLEAFFHKNCILCDATCTQDFCDACLQHLPGIPAHHCPICLSAFAFHPAQPHRSQVCGSCLATPPAFDATVAALTYTFPVDALIHALKYRAQLAIAPILARLLIDKLRYLESAHKPDLIIPMPQHARRLQERGFNQAVEIARCVARAMNIKMDLDSCKRVRNTPPQTELAWKLRQKNVRNAFNCTLDLSGSHVVVIDDVMTTGATLHALAQQLRIKGAAKISNWVIARVQSDPIQAIPDVNF